MFNEVLQLQFGKERNDAVANNQLKIHQLDNLFARVATVISFILCCVYYISVQTGSGDNIQNYILTKQYDINQIGYDINEWILRGGEAACPAVAEPPVRTDGATRLLAITPVHRGECHRLHALNGLSLDPLPEC